MEILKSIQELAEDLQKQIDSNEWDLIGDVKEFEEFRNENKCEDCNGTGKFEEDNGVRTCPCSIPDEDFTGVTNDNR